MCNPFSLAFNKLVWDLLQKIAEFRPSAEAVLERDLLENIEKKTEIKIKPLGTEGPTSAKTFTVTIEQKGSSCETLDFKTATYNRVHEESK